MNKADYLKANFSFGDFLGDYISMNDDYTNQEYVDDAYHYWRDEEGMKNLNEEGICPDLIDIEVWVAILEKYGFDIEITKELISEEMLNNL